MTLVAILSGGDWYDASVDHLVIPEGMNLDEQRDSREKWYREEYCPQLRSGGKPDFFSFPQWLIKNGAREANETEITTYQDF